MIGSLIGVVAGTAGLVLGILNYLRDRPQVVVSLVWDMEPLGAAAAVLDPAEGWGVLTVTNLGRRPIFVSHASLHIPGETKYLVLHEGLEGVKLLESDPPKRYVVRQQTMPERYSTKWRSLRGCVVDNTGKHWHSKPMKVPPSWVNVNGRSPV